MSSTGPNHTIGRTLNMDKLSRKRRILISLAACHLAFTSSFGSGVFSADSKDITKSLSDTSELSLLALALYILGYAFGPLAWGPLSELVGRSPLLKTAALGCVVVNACWTLAESIYTILACRLLLGIFAAAPLSIVPGLLVDIWETHESTSWTLVLLAISFSAPLLASIVGSTIIEYSVYGWRGTAWVALCFALSALVTTLFIIRETLYLGPCAPRDVAIFHTQKAYDYRQVLSSHLCRPWRLIIREPLLFFLSIVASLVYGLLYLTLIMIPYSYTVERKWSQSTASLPLLANICGIYSAVGYLIVRNSGMEGHREARAQYLPSIWATSLQGSALIAFGCVSRLNISWIPEVLCGFGIGFSFFVTFACNLVYVTEAYSTVVNSALTVHACMRAIVAFAMVLSSGPLLTNLGTRTVSIMMGGAFIALTPLHKMISQREKSMTSASDRRSCARVCSYEQSFESGGSSPSHPGFDFGQTLGDQMQDLLHKPTMYPKANH